MPSECSQSQRPPAIPAKLGRIGMFSGAFNVLVHVVLFISYLSMSIICICNYIKLIYIYEQIQWNIINLWIFLENAENRNCYTHLHEGTIVLETSRRDSTSLGHGLAMVKYRCSTGMCAIVSRGNDTRKAKDNEHM